MSSGIRDQLTSMQSATAQKQLAERLANGPSQELDQDAFLMLMMEQLKQQDPTNPMDNSQMLQQQAAFTQISELQKMNSALSQNNMISQAASLVGKEVTIMNPDDPTTTITGIATSANFSSNTATVTVNGKEYPLGLVMSMAEPGTAAAAEAAAKAAAEEAAKKAAEDAAGTSG